VNSNGPGERCRQYRRNAVADEHIVEEWTAHGRSGDERISTNPKPEDDAENRQPAKDAGGDVVDDASAANALVLQPDCHGEPDRKL